MKKMLIVFLGSCFITSPIFCAVPAQKPQQTKTAACKCDPCACNPCRCTNTSSCCESKTQKSENGDGFIDAIIQKAEAETANGYCLQCRDIIDAFPKTQEKK